MYDVMLNSGRVVSDMTQKHTALRVRHQERCLALHLAQENEGDTGLQNVARQRIFTYQKDLNTVQHIYSCIR